MTFLRNVGRSLRKIEVILLAASTILVSLYTIWVLFFPYQATSEKYVSSLVIISLCFTFSALGLHHGLRKQIQSSQRRSWILLAFAYLSWGIGECIWFYYESVIGKNPFPSVADFFYVFYWLLILIGVLSFPFVPVGEHENRILWLDLAIVMTTSFVLLWNFVLSPIANSSQPHLIRLISIAYPVAGFLVFAAMIAMIQRNVQKLTRGVLFFLSGGMICTIAADLLFAYFEVNEMKYSAVYLNILWMAAILFMITAVSLEKLRGETPSTGDYPLDVFPSRLLLRRSLPYLAIVIGMVLLLVRLMPQSILPIRTSGVVFGTVLLLILGSFRQHQLLVENMRLSSELERLAITDGLTGVYNKHYLNRALHFEVARAKRYSYSLAVLMIDVNGFKAYNDQFGHLRGDEALKKIAAVLANQLRDTDILGRFGGDEFMAILHESDMDGAMSVSQKMKSAIRNHPVIGNDLSVSVGVAIYRPELTSGDLLQEADRKLYQEKGNIRGAL